MSTIKIATPIIHAAINVNVTTMENKIKSLIKKMTRSGYEVKPEGAKHKDPVCGMQASEGIATRYKDVTYYFCSDHCRKEFVANPDNYVS